MDREAFLAERRTAIGGSEMADLLDIEPYGCRRKLVYLKTDAAADFPPVTTPDMERGTEMEALIVRLYGEKTGRSIVPCDGTLFRHPVDSWLAVHPDAFVSAEGQSQKFGVLSVKCPGLTNFARAKREGPPNGWMLQLQAEMLATGRTWGAFAVFNAERWEFVEGLFPLVVTPDPAFQDGIRRQAAKTWRLIEDIRAGVPAQLPDRLPPTDKRCRTCPYRTRCQGAALIEAVATEEAKWGDVKDYPEDESLAPLALDYIEARTLADEAEELQKQARERLAAALGDRPGAVTSSARIHFRPVTTTRIDPKAVREKHPKVAEECATVSVSRSLRVIPTR